MPRAGTAGSGGHGRHGRGRAGLSGLEIHATITYPLGRTSMPTDTHVSTPCPGSRPPQDPRPPGTRGKSLKGAGGAGKSIGRPSAGIFRRPRGFVVPLGFFFQAPDRRTPLTTRRAWSAGGMLQLDRRSPGGRTLSGQADTRAVRPERARVTPAIDLGGSPWQRGGRGLRRHGRRGERRSGSPTPLPTGARWSMMLEDASRVPA